MKRVVICGGIGAGKTWLATRLSEIAGIEVTHTDRLFFNENWTYKTADERQNGLANVVKKPAWIIEGVIPDIPKEIQEGKFPDIDHLILLNVPLLKRLSRYLKRSIANQGCSRPDIPDGALDGIRISTIIRIICQKNRFMARFTPGLKGLPDSVNFIILRTDKDVMRFLQYAQARHCTASVSMVAKVI